MLLFLTSCMSFIFSNFYDSFLKYQYILFINPHSLYSYLKHSKYMDTSNRTGYIDFSINIQGIDTDIKILETYTHVFIYVSQIEEQINLLDTEVKKELLKRRLNRKKDMVVFCNLKNKESISGVVNVLSDIFTN